MDASLRGLSGPLPFVARQTFRPGTMSLAVALLLGLVYAAPLLGAIGLAAWEVGQDAGGQAVSVASRLLSDVRFIPALGLSLFSAAASTVLSAAVAVLVVTALQARPVWTRLVRSLGVALAVPHAAFAIGLALLIMPAGWLARVLAPLLGWDSPPGWVTVQDPLGLSLVLALVCKEVPFLLWSLAALFARPEVARELHNTLLVGRSLGHASACVWWLVLWPRWLPRLRWPLLAVLAYSLTVVDVALVLGPTQPPTLAVLAWQALAAGDPARQAEGLAMAWSLVAALLGLAALLGGGLWLLCRGLLNRSGRGPSLPRPALTPMSMSRPTSGAAATTTTTTTTTTTKATATATATATTATATASASAPSRARRRAPASQSGFAGSQVWGSSLLVLGVFVYAAVMVGLALASVSGLWRFPDFWPQHWSLAAWQQVAQASDTVRVTALLALAAALLACGLVVGWLECTPPAWDRAALPLVLAPLVVPQIILVAGLYRLALVGHLDGAALGLLWGHVLMAVPYVFIGLAPAWRSFDPRWGLSARALGRSRWRFLWQVKLPMLRGPLAAAFAVGFAVSVAQYLSTQFLGAGRWATVTTEAVNLAADGQRLQASALALLQALLPLLAFAAAAGLARAPVGERAR